MNPRVKPVDVNDQPTHNQIQAHTLIRARNLQDKACAKDRRSTCTREHAGTLVLHLPKSQSVAFFAFSI